MTHVRTLEEAFAFILDEYNKQKSLGEKVAPKIRKFEEFGNQFRNQPTTITYQNKTYDVNSIRKLVSDHSYFEWDGNNKYINLCSTISDAIAKVSLVVENNKAVIEHNQQVAKSIKEIMQAIGVQDTRTVYEYTSSRSMKRKERKINAGYLSDISHYVPLKDPAVAKLNELRDLLAHIIETYKEFTKQQKLALQLAEEKKLEIDKKKAEEKFIFEYKVKYKDDLDYDDDAYAIFDHILNRCKYLKLAHKLLSIREDFSRFDRRMLDGFVISSTVDRDIVNDLQNHIDDWDEDGRVFRDTKWGYTALFSLASKEVKNDYDECINYIQGV